MAETDARIVKRYTRVDSIEGMRMVNNCCLLKMYPSNIDKQINGLYRATEFLNKNQYLDDYVTRMGTVVKIPTQLSLFSKRTPKGAWWQTDIEVEIGDVVWTSYKSVLDVEVVLCGNEEYYLIPYHELRLAKKEDGRYVLLNGWCLYEDIEEDKPDTDIINPEVRKRIDLSKGRIVLTGSKNRAYYKTDKKTKIPSWLDLDSDVDVRVGDIIVKDNPGHHLILENPLFAEYEHPEVYLIQRQNIIAVID